MIDCAIRELHSTIENKRCRTAILFRPITRLLSIKYLVEDLHLPDGAIRELHIVICNFLDFISTSG